MPMTTLYHPLVETGLNFESIQVTPPSPTTSLIIPRNINVAVSVINLVGTSLPSCVTCSQGSATGHCATMRCGERHTSTARGGGHKPAPSCCQGTARGQTSQMGQDTGWEDLNVCISQQNTRRRGWQLGRQTVPTPCLISFSPWFYHLLTQTEAKLPGLKAALPCRYPRGGFLRHQPLAGIFFMGS